MKAVGRFFFEIKQEMQDEKKNRSAPNWLRIATHPLFTDNSAAIKNLTVLSNMQYTYATKTTLVWHSRVRYVIQSNK